MIYIVVQPSTQKNPNGKRFGFLTFARAFEMAYRGITHQWFGKLK